VATDLGSDSATYATRLMPNAARTDTEQLLSAVNGINAPFPVPYVRDRNHMGIIR
jgi:hypothetical protein